MQCKQENCTKEAIYNVYWPGQRTKQCEEHAMKAMGLAKTMGFDVSITKLQLEDEE